jgi:hypothetical protein
MKMRKQIFNIFFWMLALPVQAQSPGGVSSPELWFQTQGSGGSLTGNYRWQDFSGDSLRLNVYDNRGAGHGDEFSNSAVRFYNGHPALDLDKLLDLKSREVLLKRSNLSQATIIGAFAPSSGFDANQMLYGVHGRAGSGVFVGTDKAYPGRESGKEPFDYGETEGMDMRYSSGDSEADGNAFRETSLRIAAYYRTLPPATGLWGEESRAVLSFNSAVVPNANVNHNTTYSIPLLENRQFTGYIPEIIAYSRLLTPLERRKVESYMAVKYGISLPVSYIGSSDQLLWDYSAYPQYNYRITGLYRDDESGLRQMESATSYEESPYYTDQLTHDYYYLSNPANRTSSSRLLVIGRGDGNSLSDGEYLFWGDNNASTTLEDEVWQEGLKRMPRQWTVKTNITSHPQALNWSVENLEFDTNGYLVSIVKAGGNSAAEGIAVTTLPLLTSNGYLGVSDYLLTGGLTLRFGAQTTGYTSGSPDYGYFIDSDFRAYKIEGGVKQSSSFALLLLAGTIEVEKTEGSLSLRVNGTRLAESEIIIPAIDRNKPFYGAVSVARGLTDAGFKLRHGGFTDTGNRIELSLANAPDFAATEEEKSVLVIDRSGTGNFLPENITYIPVGEVDLLRRKAIFYNVFFDRDGNGTDVFTFAYGKVEAPGNLQIEAPICGQANGAFTLNVDWGVRGFDYVLKDLATGNNIRSGWEGSRSIHVPGLETGNYELTVTEAGGYTFESDASTGGLLRAKTTNFLPAIDGNTTWRISNTTDSYTVGYTASTAATGSPDNILHYALKQSGNKIYKVENGKETLISNVTLQVGDRIKIVKGLISLTYYRNDTQIGSSLIRLQDYGLSFYGLIDFGQGPTELLNANAEGFFNLIDYRWDMTTGVTAIRASVASKKYEINIPACQTGSTVTETPAAPTISDNRLSVGIIPETRTLRISLNLETPSGVSLLVYDATGRPVAMKELPLPKTGQEAELSVPQAGVYIVKAITAAGEEYGNKIIIR